MQYLLLVFEIVFYSHCNIKNGAYKGWVGGRGVGVVGVVGVGGQAEGGPSLPLGYRQ